MYRNKLFFVAFCSFAFISKVNANEYTYSFDIPFSSNTSPSTFGTSAILDITLNNGNSSNFNQTYSLTQITKIDVLSVGGTLNDFFTPSTVISSILDTNITTSPTGDQAYLNFNLGNYWNTAIDFKNANSTYILQIGSGEYGNICLYSSQYSVCDGGSLWNGGINKNIPSAINYSTPTYISKFNLFYYPTIEFQGTLQSTPVPVPPSIWLFGTTLLGFFGLKHRKN